MEQHCARFVVCICFNPRPPLLAGECHQRWRRSSRGPAGFNPRPPLLAGECQFGCANDKRDSVSIHARHCWRANDEDLLSCLCGSRFQSTPAIAGGRMSGCPKIWERIMVSIHARHCWRANGPVGGTVLDPFGGFNPRPPLLAGECSRGRRAGSLPTGCFNPRPPLLAGECRTARGWRRWRAVSIHARHCWRANGQYPSETKGYCMFQSTPAIAGGRMTDAASNKCGHDLFQSTPAIAGGRMGVMSASRAVALVSIHARHCWRANVRCATAYSSDMSVSIHARHCWRANGGEGGMTEQWIIVSIHARHCWRANGDPLREHGSRSSFNPRPPLLAGEWASRWTASARHSRFQSTPAIAGGRM